MTRLLVLWGLLLAACGGTDSVPPMIVGTDASVPPSADAGPGPRPADGGPLPVDAEPGPPDAAFPPDAIIVVDGGPVPIDAAPIDPDAGGFEERFGEESCLQRLELELGWDFDEAFSEHEATVVDVVASGLEVDSPELGVVAFRWSGPPLTNAFQPGDLVTIERTEGDIQEHRVDSEAYAATIARTTREFLMSSIEPFTWNEIEFGAHSERERCGIDRFGPIDECPGGFGEEFTREMTPTVNGRNALVGMSFTIMRTSYTVAQAASRLGSCTAFPDVKMSIARLEVLMDPPPIPED